MNLINRVLRAISLLLLAAFLSPASVFAADATSFDPTKVPIQAKGAGGVPVGTVVSWPVASNPADPANWLECNGQSVSPTVYPELFALIGANVPDYRGLFLRGHGSQVHAQENGSTIGVTTTTHSSGALGEVQGDATRNITGTTGQYDIYRHAGSGAFYHYSTVGGGTDSGNTGVINGFDASRVVPTANENRPVNTAVRYLIRALP